MSEYRPIAGRELTQLQFMHSLYKVLADDESLKPRMQWLGNWWRYKGLVANLHQIFDSLWKTLPPEKRDRINAVWSNQELYIANRGQPVDPTGDMLYVPKSVIVNMAQQLQKNECAMCLGGHQDRKNCQFRRAMIDLTIPDLRREEKQSGKCVGHLFNWEA